MTINRNNNLENTVAKIFLSASLPALAFILTYLLFSDLAVKIKIPIALVTFLPWIYGYFLVQQIILERFKLLENFLEGLRTGNYQQRLAQGDIDGTWTQISEEINRLTELLQNSRIDAVESALVLDKLIAEIDVPLFVFDYDNHLTLFNHAAKQLFDLENREIENSAVRETSLTGLNPQQLSLTVFFDVDDGQIVEHQFPQRHGRWEVKQRNIIQKGQQHKLLLINDLSRTLRLQENQAWQKLIRVLSHELNNSLASIKSMSQTLLAKSQSKIPLDNERQKFEQGLSLIEKRCNVLQRFISGYSRLAKLPPPQSKEFSLSDLIKNIAQLENQVNVQVQGKVKIIIHADPDQFELLFTNLLKNALESAAPNASEVNIKWDISSRGLSISLTDNGRGISNADNLFIPFFTTKSQNSGIGLIICRQIMEAHNGTIGLENCPDSTGCIVKLWLPSSVLVF